MGEVIPWADWSSSGLLAAVVLMILTGRLVPRSTLAEMREDRDRWRSAHETSEEGRRVSLAQNVELLEVARIAGHVIEALPKAKPDPESVTS